MDVDLAHRAPHPNVWRGAANRLARLARRRLPVRSVNYGDVVLHSVTKKNCVSGVVRYVPVTTYLIALQIEPPKRVIGRRNGDGLIFCKLGKRQRNLGCPALRIAWGVRTD